MQIDVGYFYFIKDSFFDIMDDPELMKNKESGNKRPCIIVLKVKNMIILYGLFLLAQK